MAKKGRNANLQIGLDSQPLDEGIEQTGKKLEDFTKKAGKAAKDTESNLTQMVDKGKKQFKELSDASDKSTQRIAENAKKARNLTTEIANRALEKAAGVKLQEEERRRTIAFRQNAGVAAAVSRGSVQRGNVQSLLEIYDRRREQQRAATDERIERRQAAAEQRREEKVHNQFIRGLEREDAKEKSKANQAINRALLASPAMQARVSAALADPMEQSRRAIAMGLGATRTQAFQGTFQRGGFDQQQSLFLAGGGGRRPPSLGGPGGRGGMFGGLGGLVRGAASALGIGVGGYAVGQAGRALIEAERTATAYDRQRVAAEKLAGSQAQLNALLEAYGKASGGAVDDVTSLANVTRLLATGFAEDPGAVDKIVRATRGASIALGKPQEYILQETQLAISNTSVKRLDQIGLGVEEVTDKIKELRANNAGMSREMAFQQAVLGLMSEKFGALSDSAEGQATEIEKLAVAWKNLGLAVGQASQGPLNQGAKWLTKLLNFAAEEAREGQEENRRNQIRQDTRLSEGGMAGFSFDDLMGALTGRTGTQVRAQRALDNGSFSFGPRGDGPNTSGATARAWSRPPEQMEVMNAARDQMLAFEKQVNEQRLAEIQQYESQRASIIRSYGKQVVREEQDFVRMRARGLRDYEKSVMDIMRDAQEREAEMQEDLNEALADATEDSEKRIAEINKDYQKNRERDEKDHRDRLLKAAGSLDAIAVLEERRRWKRENDEKRDAHKESLDEEKEALEERKRDALEAHAERLEDARKADADRLEDMRVARAQQLADEDEDREIRNARAAEDFNDQVEELDRQHAITMQRLADEAEAQRSLLQDALEKDLAEVGIYIEGYHAKMRERDAATEKWIENFIKQLEEQIKRENRMSLLQDPETGNLVEYASGGPVNRTGPAILHAGEFVLSKGMLANMAQSGSMSTSNREININQGAIVIQTTPGYEHLVGDAVEERLIELLGRV